MKHWLVASLFRMYRRLKQTIGGHANLKEECTYIYLEYITVFSLSSTHYRDMISDVQCYDL